MDDGRGYKEYPSEKNPKHSQPGRGRKVFYEKPANALLRTSLKVKIELIYFLEIGRAMT